MKLIRKTLHMKLYNKLKDSRFQLISIIFIGFIVFNKLNSSIYNFKSSDIL